jgi:hypothetical protein
LPKSLIWNANLESEDIAKVCRSIRLSKEIVNSGCKINQRSSVETWGILFEDKLKRDKEFVEWRFKEN